MTRKKGPHVAPPAPLAKPAADVQTLATTPVTLGVVLLLGGALFAAIVAVFVSLQQLTVKVNELNAATARDMGEVKAKLEQLLKK